MNYVATLRNWISSNTPSPTEIARAGEAAVLVYLKHRGLVHVCSNWRCRAGEIDLIFMDDTELVLVEVKTRACRPGAAARVMDNIDERKRRKLRTLAEIYLLSQYRDRRPARVRIDVVGITLDSRTLRARTIEHLIAAI